MSVIKSSQAVNDDVYQITKICLTQCILSGLYTSTLIRIKRLSLRELSLTSHLTHNGTFWREYFQAIKCTGSLLLPTILTNKQDKIHL